MRCGGCWRLNVRHCGCFSLHWYGSRSGRHLAVACAVGVLGQLPLHQSRSALEQAHGDFVFAPIRGCLGIILTTTLTIDEVIHDLAVALASDFGLAIFKQPYGMGWHHL